MKKIVIVIAFSMSLFFNAKAQFRKLTDNEITYYNTLYPQLFAAMPTQYKDWKGLAGRTGTFDIRKYWRPVSVSGNDCTGTCPVSTGKGDPYSLTCNIDFSMPGNQSSKLMAAAYKTIKDFNDAKQIASALKSTAKAKLSIYIISNVSAGGQFLMSYCGSNPLTNLTLPLPATLAVLGTHTEACPFMSSGRPDMKGDYYYDNALIFLGKAVVAKKADDRHDGQVRTTYDIGFDKSKMGTLVTQNIVVVIKGDAEDIQAAVKLIDWQKLNAVISK